MKKKFISGIILAAMLISCIPTFAQNTQGKIKMYFKDSLGKETELVSDVAPFEENGILYIPFRCVFEEHNALVEWDENSQKATATKNGIAFTPEKFICRNNRTFVKSDDIKNFLGTEINFNKESGEVQFYAGVDYHKKWEEELNKSQSIELSTKDEYPIYLADEAKETVNDIESLLSEKLTSIAFLTDPHYEPSQNHRLLLTRAVNTYKDISSQIDIDGLVLGGDHIYEASKDKRTEAFADYRKNFEEIKYYPINGNHDDGNYWDSSYIKSSEKTSHFERYEMYDMLYDHLPDKGAVFNADDPKSLYYYIDNVKDKVRYIMLDGHNFTDDNGKNINPGYGGLGQKQMDWFANEALKFEEEGWTVLVFMHQMQKPESSSTAHLRVHYPVRLILDAYKSGDEIKGIYPESEEVLNRIECNYDFSSYKNRAEIAGIIAGHWHTDLVEYSPKKIPYVFTACFRPDNKAREDGTKSEILFDIVTIDRAGKRLYVSRVGAGMDRSGISYK